jgi:molecular chaperone DnaK (HSP70)
VSASPDKPTRPPPTSLNPFLTVALRALIIGTESYLNDSNPMKYNKKSTKVKLTPFRINMQMNIMRSILQVYFRYPHIRPDLHGFAGHKLEEVRGKFTQGQLEHMSQRLLPWLQWNTGKYRRLTPFEGSTICERAMRKVLKIGHEHCMCLVILAAEYQAKPVRR